MKARELIESVLDVAFPPQCVSCRRTTVDCDGLRSFCRDCQSELSLFDGPVCVRCAEPIAETPVDDSLDCPRCREERWAFDQTIALGPYDGLLRHLVLLGKRRSGAAGVVALGRLLAERNQQRISEISPAAVVSVPLHWSRRLARRADGVGQLAEAVANGLSIPCRRWLSRSRSTPHQTSVAPSDRSSNVRGAFRAAIPSQFSGETILLVDDVLTTGATCHAAARELKRAGAGRVVAVVAARPVSRL